MISIQQSSILASQLQPQVGAPRARAQEAAQRQAGNVFSQAMQQSMDAAGHSDAVKIQLQQTDINTQPSLSDPATLVGRHQPAVPPRKPGGSKAPLRMGAEITQMVHEVQQIAQDAGFVGLSEDAVLRAYHHGSNLLVDYRA